MMSSFGHLCEKAKGLIPKSFGEDAWYLVAAAALIASGKPAEVGSLSTYLRDNQKPAPSPEQRVQLSLRLRDVMMKEWTLVGIPSVIIAMTSLAKVEGEHEMQAAQLSDKWKNLQLDVGIENRGTRFLQTLYKENIDSIFASWGAHSKDFEWMEKHVIYGMYLSDHSVLSPIETELVTLTSIMCQGISAPTIWHLRGLRRLGPSGEDVENVQQAVEAVATWCGRSVEGWPRVSDVKDEL